MPSCGRNSSEHAKGISAWQGLGLGFGFIVWGSGFGVYVGFTVWALSSEFRAWGDITRL